MIARTAQVFVLLLASAIPHSAIACSCAEPSPREALLGSDAVIAGRVIEMGPPGDTKDLELASVYVDVLVNVSATWKGRRTSTLTVRTAQDGAMCGFSFAIGEEYLIYASSIDETTFDTSICSRTKLLSEAKEDLDVLGAPSTPQLTEAALAGLLRDLRSASAERRMNACARLSMHPEAASQSVPLIALFLSADRGASERKSAADALAQLGPAAVVALPALVAMLADPDPDMGASAAGALARMGEVAEPAVGALVACLHDQPAMDALESVLERLPPARSAELPELERRLEAFEWRRSEAVHALGKIGPKAKSQASEIVLRALLDGRVQPLQASALRAMGAGPEAGASVVRHLVENPSLGWPGIAILEHLGPDAGLAAIPVLTARLRSPRDFERDVAADALGAMGPAAWDAVPALVSALDEVSISEHSVIKALAAIRDPRSAGVLARAAHGSDLEMIREVAVRGLKRMGLDPATAVPAPGRPRGQGLFGNSDGETLEHRATPAAPPRLDAVPRLPFVTGFALDGAGMCGSMAPHPDGIVIALGCRQQVARVHDVLSGHVVQELRKPPSSGTNAQEWDFGGSVAVAGDTTLVGVPRYTGSVIECGALLAFPKGASTAARIDSPIPTRGGRFGSIIAAAQGRIAAVLGKRKEAPSGSIVILDEAGSLLREIVLTRDVPHVAQAAFVGNLLAVGARTVHGDGAPGMVMLFDAGTGKLIRVLRAPAPSDDDGFGDEVVALGEDALLVSCPDRLHVVDVATGVVTATVENPTDDGRSPAAAAAIDADRFVASSRSVGGSVVVHDRSGRALGVATSPLQGPFVEIGLFGSDVAVTRGRLVATVRNIDAATFNAWVRGDRSGDSFQLGSDIAYLVFDLEAARPAVPDDEPPRPAAP